VNAPELFVEQIEIGPIKNFVYILGSRSTREVALVDPAWDIDGLLARLDERDYALSAVLVTHYHPDHVGGGMGQRRIAGLAELMARRPVRVYAHREEAAGVQRVTGLSASDIAKVDSGDRLKLGQVEIEFLHTPGHTPGSQCFRVSNTLVSGDTLFIDGCGRVDLPGSDPEQMYHSLRKLASLPEDVVLLPGHNYSAEPDARLGDVKTRNPYMRISDLPTWQRLMGS
jgi:hydroxyacylglutathione hydrolase